MSAREWERGQPPNGELVEVENHVGPEGAIEVIQVRAIWGDRDRGILPHWEAADRSVLYHSGEFPRWRRLEAPPQAPTGPTQAELVAALRQAEARCVERARRAPVGSEREHHAEHDGHAISIAIERLEAMA